MLYLYISFIYYILSTSKSVVKKVFHVLWRNIWLNRDVAAKWAVKKDTPAGKFGIKLQAKKALNRKNLTD